MKKILLTLLGLVCINSMAFADDFKVGYINVDRIFAETTPAKSVRTALTDKYAPQQSNLQKMNVNLTNEQLQMNQLASKSSDFDKLSKQDQAKLKSLNSKYQLDQGDFQKKYSAYQQGLQQDQEVGLSMLMTKINAIVKDVSEKQGYDLVLTSNQFIYAKAKYDITDMIKDKVNTIDVTEIIKQINNPTKALQPSTASDKK